MPLAPWSPSSDLLNVYVIYDSPLDAPGDFVVRRWEYETPRESFRFPSLAAAREAIPPGLVRLLPAESDAKSIVETWL